MKRLATECTDRTIIDQGVKVDERIVGGQLQLSNRAAVAEHKS